jgi:general secretion pathway protein D
MRSLLVVLVIVVVVSSSPRPVRAGDEPDGDSSMYACGKPRGRFALSLKPEVELKELAAWAMGVSCKRILYASALASRSAKITMMTPGEMTFGQAWGLFQHALHAMGLAIVKKGDTLEIVESSAAKEAALAIVKSFPDGGADMVRLLFRPEHVDVDDLKVALELVKSKNGVVSPLPKLGAMLITDDASHIARMSTLVRELDRPATGDGVFAIPVEHVDATTLVETLTKLLAETPGTGAVATTPGAGAGPRLVAAPRVNAVFVVGTAGEYLRVRAIARALDLDVGDTARIQSIHLRNAKAKDVAATLSTLITGTSGAEPAGSRPTRGGDPAEGAVTGPTRFAADDASNTLLVLASPRDAIAVRAMVEDLDQPQRQIYIEALVLEVVENSSRDIGISAHGGKPGDDGMVVGSFQNDGLSTLDPKTALGASGLIGGVLGNPLTGVLGEMIGETVPSFGVLIQLAAHESRLDVLASPHVMMLDNKLSTISVGSKIPVKTGGATNTALAPGVVQETIAHEKVALTLAITPHVSPAGPGSTTDTVRLEVKLESNQLGDKDYAGLGPSWSERSIDTTVILRDQESVVLGGLVEERIDETVDKIPILGDIPILGHLFRSTHKIRNRSNLLVVLTPHLIDDSIGGRRILERRMRERDEFLTSTLDLERRVLEPDVDYRKKRGLIAEIDATVTRIEQDRAALDAAGKRLEVPAGRIDEEAAPVPAP